MSPLHPAARGSRHGLSKLTEADVIEMRESYAQGVRQADLAARFGVAVSTVSRIVNRTVWIHC